MDVWEDASQQEGVELLRLWSLQPPRTLIPFLTAPWPPLSRLFEPCLPQPGPGLCPAGARAESAHAPHATRARRTCRAGHAQRPPQGQRSSPPLVWVSWVCDPRMNAEGVGLVESRYQEADSILHACAARTLPDVKAVLCGTEDCSTLRAAGVSITNVLCTMPFDIEQGGGRLDGTPCRPGAGMRRSAPLLGPPLCCLAPGDGGVGGLGSGTIAFPCRIHSVVVAGELRL